MAETDSVEDLWRAAQCWRDAQSPSEEVACVQDIRQTVRRLADAGIDPNTKVERVFAQGPFLEDALGQAIEESDSDLIHILLEAGVRPLPSHFFHALRADAPHNRPRNLRNVRLLLGSGLDSHLLDKTHIEEEKRKWHFGLGYHSQFDEALRRTSEQFFQDVLDLLDAPVAAIERHYRDELATMSRERGEYWERVLRIDREDAERAAATKVERKASRTKKRLEAKRGTGESA